MMWLGIVGVPLGGITLASLGDGHGRRLNKVRKND